MTDHLSLTVLGALADGELSGEHLARVNEHLADCPQCTSAALSQSLLKSATARAGRRYSAPPELAARLSNLAAQAPNMQETRADRPQTDRGMGRYGWAAAAALLLVSVSLFFIQRNAQRSSYETANLVAEVCDQHIAAIAPNNAPEVLSSDRHTVKPWFQGKIPFSFNLPENLPPDTTLDGADLTYLHNQPTAQLLYSVGKHRVSVFVRQRSKASEKSLPAGHIGFHLASFHTDDLDVVAVSDVDPSRLIGLVESFQQAQTTPSK